MTEFVKGLLAIEAAFAHGYTVDIEKGIVFGLYGQKLRPQGGDHPVVTLQTPGVGKGNESVIHIHCLIAYKKFGRKAFKRGLEIRHLNNDASNNRGMNISFGTRRQNMLDVPVKKRKLLAIKRTRHLVGKVNCNRSLTDDQVRYIRRRFKNKRRAAIRELAHELSIDYSKILLIVNGDAYASVK